MKTNVSRVAFFDAGGVLLYVPQLWPVRMAAALQEFGHLVTPEEVSEARARAQLPPWPKTLEEEGHFWPVVYSATLMGLSISNPHPTSSDIHDRVWWVHHARLFDDAVPTLGALRNRGLRLGLISNASPSMQLVLERLGILGYFNPVVISDVLGILKPDRRIFEHALGISRVDPSQAVFVDDLPENVVAARELGMTAFLLDRDGHQPDQSGLIRSLSEIPKVI